MNGKIVPGSKGEVDGVYQQVLVIVLVQEEGAITTGVPLKGLVPKIDFPFDIENG